MGTGRVSECVGGVRDLACLSGLFHFLINDAGQPAHDKTGDDTCGAIQHKIDVNKDTQLRQDTESDAYDSAERNSRLFPAGRYGKQRQI